MAYANGYRQCRPYSIYVVGPDDGVADLFYSTTIEAVRNKDNPHHDEVEKNRDETVPALGNSVTVRYKPRRAGDAHARYSLICDSAILNPLSDSLGTLPRVDAAVVLFCAENKKQFVDIRDKHLPRLVAIAERQRGERLVLHLLAHKKNIFHNEQGYDALDMARLCKKHHALFLHGVYTQPAPCREAIDSVMFGLICEHARYQLNEREKARAAAMTAEASSMTSLSNWVPEINTSGLWFRVLNFQHRWFPSCAPEWPLDDADRMSEEDRKFHAPQGPLSNATPMGERTDIVRK